MFPAHRFHANTDHSVTPWFQKNRLGRMASLSSASNASFSRGLRSKQRPVPSLSAALGVERSLEPLPLSIGIAFKVRFETNDPETKSSVPPSLGRFSKLGFVSP